MNSPTQRSLAKLKAEGYTCSVVEKWNVHVGIRQDFCGGIDLIAFKSALIELDPMQTRNGSTCRRFIGGGRGILGVQCCGQTGHAAHKAKLLAEPRMREWIAAGGRLVIHSWRKLAVVKKDGKKGKTKRYECREEEITLSHFLPDPIADALVEQGDHAAAD